MAEGKAAAQIMIAAMIGGHRSIRGQIQNRSPFAESRRAYARKQFEQHVASDIFLILKRCGSSDAPADDPANERFGYLMHRLFGNWRIGVERGLVQEKFR